MTFGPLKATVRLIWPLVKMTLTPLLRYTSICLVSPLLLMTWSSLSPWHSTIQRQFCPSKVVWLFEASSCIPKVCKFDLRSGPIPRFWV